MESSGEPGRVNVSAYTYDLIRRDFDCEYRGRVDAKGKGEVDMYFVNFPPFRRLANPERRKSLCLGDGNTGHPLPCSAAFRLHVGRRLVRQISRLSKNRVNCLN